MKAVVLDAKAKTAVLHSRPVPHPLPGEALIRVHAVALNPVDALYVFNPIGASGRTIGSDFAGTVVSSADSALLPGQRVAGFVQGASSGNRCPGPFEHYGAFAEFLTCPVDLLWHVPDAMSLESAATVSLCALTAAQALYYRLGLKAPFEWTSPKKAEASPTTVLIYGASTSVGMFAAQLVRRSATASGKPLRMIGMASSTRFEMLYAEPYAYDVLVDYRDTNWQGHVRQATKGVGVDAAFDCISEGSTVRNISQVLHRDGEMAILRSKAYGAWDPKGLPEGIKEPIYGAVWEGLGAQIEYNHDILPASPEARSFAVSFYRWLSELPLEANPVRFMPGGLERIAPDGLALLGPGAMEQRGRNRSEEWMKPISAEKLVYKINE